MRIPRLCAFLLCVCIVAPAAAAVRPEEQPKEALLVQPPGAGPEREKLAADEPSELGLAARSFVESYGGQWEFRVDRRTGKFDLIQGSGIPMIPGKGNRLGPETLSGLDLPDGRLTPEALEPLARAFIAANGAAIAPLRGRLVLDKTSSLVRDDGRLVSLYFDWFVDDLRVDGAAVFIRLNSGNITQFGASLVGPIAIETKPSLDAEGALAALLAHSGDGETARLHAEPELLIQPEEDDPGRLDYRLIWRLVYRNPGHIETWEGRVDARSGEIVGFRDTNAYARVIGGIYPRTVLENNETVVPMPEVDVQLGNGQTATTDDAGFYNYSGGEVTSGLNGRWFDTNCQGCSGPAQPKVETDVGTGWLSFREGGTDQFGNGFATPADRNAFYHMNRVRRLAVKWLSGNTWFFNENFTTNVNIDNTCNAVFTGNAVNFYRSGGGCNNTGEIADVMYHEYGHGVDGNTRGGDGATGEGTADVVSMLITHSPLVGPGFYTNGNPVRNLDSATSSTGELTVANIGSICPVIGTLGPLGYEVHCEGEIYGQVAWELGEALAAKHGQQTGWRETERIFFTALPDSGSYLSNGSFPIYDAYLNADDDDGNLANGTPNAREIFEAFDRHGIANAESSVSPQCARPAQPSLTVTSSCDHFDLSWTTVPGIDHYVVFRSHLLADTAYFPVADLPAGQTTYTDFEVAPGTDYYYLVQAVTPAGCESTIEDPKAGRLVAQPILSVTAAMDDDTPRGNRSGFADPGEEVDLTLMLENLGEIATTNLSGSVVSSTPGVTLIEGVSDWTDLGVGQVGSNLETLRFETDDLLVGCGDVLDFQFVPSDSSGCGAETSFFQVRLGEDVVDFQDGFETDLGWQPDLVNSTASTGQWIRGNPNATTYQPGDDVTEPGSNCWYTGANPGGSAGTDDVDDGLVILLSSTFDLTGLDGAEVSYHRWYGNSEPGTDPTDFFSVDVSSDGGANWVNLEKLENTSQPSWTRVQFMLEDHIALTDQVVFRFSVQDGLADGAVVEGAVDELVISRVECDDTPACFSLPDFAGLSSATPGSSCGEIDLSWGAGDSNCINAELTYNVYRSTVSGFTPGPGNRIASGLSAGGITDTQLGLGDAYYYVVRAFDSRSGEESNTVERSAVAPVGPDGVAPVFGGVSIASSGASCGTTVLDWAPAVEACNFPVTYDVYRSTDPGFTPGPETLVASTFDTTMVDLAPDPGVQYTYVVRARDNAGNAETNMAKISADAALLDLTIFGTSFEPSDEAWKAVAPNDASTGNWEWGDPDSTAYQSEDDATPDGVNAWITGLGPTPSNNDVDGGTTTLLSATYDFAGASVPAVRYARWFTNDRGGSPGDATDSLVVEVSNDSGMNWTLLEEVGAGTPLAWIDVEIPLPVAPTSAMTFRFTAADLGTGSLVEAGIDEFKLVDLGQGCSICSGQPGLVETIFVGRSQGSPDDVVIDWSAGAPAAATFLVYKVAEFVVGPDEVVLIGTTDQTSFVHEGAAASQESFYYRVAAVDECGVRSDLE